MNYEMNYEDFRSELSQVCDAVKRDITRGRYRNGMINESVPMTQINAQPSFRDQVIAMDFADAESRIGSWTQMMIQELFSAAKQPAYLDRSPAKPDTHKASDVLEQWDLGGRRHTVEHKMLGGRAEYIWMNEWHNIEFEPDGRGDEKDWERTKFVSGGPTPPDKAKRAKLRAKRKKANGKR
jgi:hypothetical protein